MIRSLYIKDYALIDELEVSFGRGLNIITGETGAGKSILLGALQLLMGERASTEAVRTGADKAIVEGFFQMSGDESLLNVLEAAGIDRQKQLIIRREVTASYSRAFVNDTPVNLTVLKALADLQIDLHGQHQHQSLLREDTHRMFLDELGQLDSALADYTMAYSDVAKVDTEINSLLRRKAELERSRELSEFQLKEIDAVEAKIGEQEDLEREASILDNAEMLLKASTSIFKSLYEDDNAVIDRLADARRQLDDIVPHDDSLEPLSKEIKSAIIALQEVATSINDYAGNIELDPVRLERVRDRIGQYEMLKKKYGGTIEDVLTFAEEKRAEVTLVANFDVELDSLRKKKAELLAILSKAAVDLSNQRKATAVEVEGKMTSILRDLDIKEAQFEVRFHHTEDANGWVTLEDSRVVKATTSGIDEVEFYISTNPGEDLKPLVDVASGGEISRIMLALKTILATTGGIPLMVFDEVDVGISGRIAQQVGLKLRDLSARHQVICITHLPQIAAMADRHFVVEKHVASGRTTSKLRTLELEERAATIASLIGGKTVTKAAIASARELIESVPGRN